MLHDHYYIIAISDKTGKAESRMMMSYRNHLSLIFPEAIILEVNRKLILFFDTKEVGICLNVLEAFLEKYDFSGKKIVLFATSGGSGFGNTVKELKPSAPGAEIVEGKLLNRANKQEIEKWVKSL